MWFRALELWSTGLVMLLCLFDALTRQVRYAYDTKWKKPHLIQADLNELHKKRSLFFWGRFSHLFHFCPSFCSFGWMYRPHIWNIYTDIYNTRARCRMHKTELKGKTGSVPKSPNNTKYRNEIQLHLNAPSTGNYGQMGIIVNAFIFSESRVFFFFFMYFCFFLHLLFITQTDSMAMSTQFHI